MLKAYNKLQQLNLIINEKFSIYEEIFTYTLKLCKVKNCTYFFMLVNEKYNMAYYLYKKINKLKSC